MGCRDLLPLVHRSHANAIFHRIRLQPKVSQRDIVARTGIDKSTVSLIVNRFDEMGLIDRKPNEAGKRRGRPTEGLSIAARSGLLVGVQVEADEIAFVAAGLDGVPIVTQRQSYGGTLEDLDTIIAGGVQRIRGSIGRQGPMLGVGVSLPGLLSSDGFLVHAPIFGWRDVPILERLGRAIDDPLFLGNDGRAAAMAEHMFGTCVDVDDFVYLFSGSGVGGALFLNGQLYRGARGFAGELGHIKVVPQGRLCSCGASGCLSAYLSERALAAEIDQVSGVPVRSFKDIMERAATDDPVVLEVLNQASEVLGLAVSSLINIFNPPLVVLGGDMALAEPFLRPGLDRILKRVAHPAIYAQTRVIFSELSAFQPYLGGVALALDGATGLDTVRIIT